MQNNSSQILREEPRNSFEEINLYPCGDDLDKFYL